MNEVTRQVRQKIMKGELERAADILLNHFEENVTQKEKFHSYNEVIHQIGQLNEVKKKEQSGVLSFDEINRQRNIIRSSLLQIVFDIDNNVEDSGYPLKKVSHKKQSNNNFLMYLITGGLLIVIGVLYFNLREQHVKKPPTNLTLQERTTDIDEDSKKPNGTSKKHEQPSSKQEEENISEPVATPEAKQQKIETVKKSKGESQEEENRPKPSAEIVKKSDEVSQEQVNKPQVISIKTRHNLFNKKYTGNVAIVDVESKNVISNILNDVLTERQFETTTSFFRANFLETYRATFFQQGIEILEDMSMPENLKCVCLVKEYVKYDESERLGHGFTRAKGEVELKILNIVNGKTTTLKIPVGGSGAGDQIAYKSFQENFIKEFQKNNHIQKFELCKK